MKQKIAILAGGDSGEFQVSVRSAKSVADFIDKEKYEVYSILMQGKEWYCIQNEIKYPVNKNDFSILIDTDVIYFDAAFIIIHGTPGEDGKLQGYLEMLKIPYTSCNSITSALTFNKYFCNGFVKNFGINIAPSVWIKKSDSIDEKTILAITGLPCFVKPNCGGSSVGMTKVNLNSELKTALDIAFKEDPEVLIEAFNKGREITCGVVQIKGEIIALPLCEVKSKKEYFDFEAKYNELLADEIVPAVITEAETQTCTQLSKELYKKLNCFGVVRFDYIMDEQGIFNFLEVNTVPGMSAESIVPKMVKAHGWTLSQFYGLLIEEALNR
ncbi:MAG: D-alanine--D-alanine ligase [Bacteroidales bacterium]|jgi:D-alanine-D-alanine ligase|nr:D-alanine--D-alanine ligase [Bacteroidales bacterium]